jgi:transposase InsO family protein
MIAILIALWSLLGSLFKSRVRIAAENLLLRHQLNIARRCGPRRAQLSNWDRWGMVWVYRIVPDALNTVSLVRPETVIRWHRQGFRAFWWWKTRFRGGRPRISKELRNLVREMSQANPLWGAPRIHGELLKLGIEVSQSTVANYMPRYRRPPSQSWKTFLRNHAPDIAALDVLVVPTVGFNLLYCLVVLGHDRRQLVSFGITAHPTAEWLARQITEAFPWDERPRYLIRDRAGIYGDVFTIRLRTMGIRDRPIAARSPWQNGYVERVIGSIRRECLDHIIVTGEQKLRRIMQSYVDYYNRARTHLALRKDAPSGRRVERRGGIRSAPVLGGLHHRYARI